MALKLPIPFPIFAPILNPNPLLNPTHHHRPPSELRFARWNNANAEKFNERRRSLQEIEDDIRRERRFDSATRIASIYDSATTRTSSGERFKSIGTPSSPSTPSIPGKKSKYSKNPNPNADSHPAFRRYPKSVRKLYGPPSREKPEIDRRADVRIGEDGMSYVIDGAPFEYKYSYTETPKVKPVKLREAPYAPFGPTTMPRPWTGRAPLPPSKKKLKEFDSFQLPPPHKKGVKPVQAPGPYLAGSGPKYVKSREEILGEPLTEEEIKDLVNGCIKTKRQLNMGRDGLTHNMLDNIHAHWKRRRVCKIKCKGVCTVDMDNVRQQLEERTGGKIIYNKGGVIFLFRGRNYNYRTRPRFPLMLWKPVTPVYPRLVQRVPEDLMLEEATDMRKKGQKLIPICKLGKNGVYTNLVKNVREAFEECELVRINCQGMNGGDYRKIGAKLKDLVPCVLLSFANEHILMWRGRNWKSSLPKLEKDSEKAKESDVDNAASVASPMESQEVITTTGSISDASLDLVCPSTVQRGFESTGAEGNEDSPLVEYVEPCSATGEVSNEVKTFETETRSDIQSPVDDRAGATMKTNYSASISECTDVEPAIKTDTSRIGTRLDITGSDDQGIMLISRSDTLLPAVGSTETKLDSVSVGSTETKVDSVGVDSFTDENQQVSSEPLLDVNQPARVNAPCTEGVLSLLQQAVEGGMAIVLEESHLDDDIIYQKMVAFSQSAPPGPVFRHRPRRVRVEESEDQVTKKQNTEALEPKEMTTITVKERNAKKDSKSRKIKDFGESLQNVVPLGSLRVDELAKLLA
ncbi:RNA-binding, CRM domain containing protein [Trema orientale]|uniref:RNA-binding, CRM domain containing protein n=1 Tax=Trema orientale TaxID=63057 RepID=A0A2P5FST5_TREOI|nr:RNA-binding, CRM domain containing protein [Trema orientale]